MNINASIVDMRVQKLATDHAAYLSDELGRKDPTTHPSAAFVALAIQQLLDLEIEEALDTLTDGADDFGVDAIHVSDVHDNECVVTMVQGKYAKNLDAQSMIDESTAQKMTRAVGVLFDPRKPIAVNRRLEERVEAIRSLVMDGIIPKVRAVFASNVQGLGPHAQAEVDRAKVDFGQQVQFETLNHNDLVRIMSAIEKVDDRLQLHGKAIVEDFNYRRVLVGKVAVKELARLFDQHGDKLLERNIRRFLGESRINRAIADTLRSPDEQANFYFYNNGITILCSKFDYNALANGDWQVHIKDMQVINGGQTCRTVQQVLKNGVIHADAAYAMVRVYQLPNDDAQLVHAITYATNNQNPVDLKDLKSNDPIQVKLQQSIEALGYTYRRTRGTSAKPGEITIGSAAEAVIAVWRYSPYLSKWRIADHFGKLYELIFTPNLNGAEVICAQLLYRIAESRRRNLKYMSSNHCSYSGPFAAMLMGIFLKEALVAPLDHRNFAQAKQLIDERGAIWYEIAVKRVDEGLKQHFGDRPVSLQQLAATFRRADLISILLAAPSPGS